MDIAFRLDVVESEDEWVVFCTSPFGRTVRKVPAPFTAGALDDRLAAVEKSLIRSTAQITTRRAVAPERVAQDFGSEISDVLLSGDVRILFSRCREKAREQKQPMRVLIDPVGPNVSRIPWEFAADPDTRDDYLALRVSVARSPHLMDPVPPLRVDPPLRVLGIMSKPADLPPLEVERERREVSEALGRLSSDLVEVVWLPGDRWHDLADAVRSEPWHVLHFIGHGGFDEDAESGYLELSDDDGNAIRAMATDVGRLIADNPQLRMVVLNACESAMTGGDGFFSSTAAKLMREGVPAVVAMQYEISDPAALAFSSSFYEGLARGLPVDRAVTLARESVKMTLRSLEWATPVLFLASDETHVFTVPAQAGAAYRAPRPAPQADVAATSPSPVTAAAGSSIGPPAGAAVSAGSTVSSDWLTATRNKLADVVRGTMPTDSAPESRASEASVRGRADAPVPVLPAPECAGSPAGAPARPARRAGQFRAASSCHAAVGPRGLLALAGSDGVLRVVAGATGNVVGQCSLPHRERPLCSSWSPWPRHVVTAYDQGLVVVWDLETEVPVRVLQTGTRRVNAMAFSGDGRWLATVGESQVRVFDSAGACVKHLVVAGDEGRTSGYPRRLQSLSAVAFTPDDRHLVVAGDDGLVRQYDSRGQLSATWQHPSGVVALDASNERLVTASTSGRISFWGWDGRLRCRTEHGGGVERMRCSSDGRLLATVAVDRTLRVWGSAGALLAEGTLSGSAVGVGFLPDDKTVLTATQAGDVDLWTITEEL